VSERTKIALVFGGKSSEHGISCLTAAIVLGAIDRERFDIVAVGISKSGRWSRMSLEEVADLHITGDATPEAPGPAPGAGGRVSPLMPNPARVVRDNVETTVPVSEVQASDMLIVGAGERVATDGTVVAGQSWLDTSAITGESIPVGVAPGSSVSAGSVNGSGTLRIRATSDGLDNSLTQIVRLVEQAQSAKGERARFADRVARPLVPAVLVASLLIVLFGFLVGDPATWTQRALVVLVAASPCAMAIAVPVTVISAVGAASKLGVVIKSGVAFEQLGTIQTVAFDKTGTLTENNPRVVATHFVIDDALPMAAAVLPNKACFCASFISLNKARGWLK